jgi:hypothetical protein
MCSTLIAFPIHAGLAHDVSVSEGRKRRLGPAELLLALEQQLHVPTPFFDSGGIAIQNARNCGFSAQYKLSSAALANVVLMWRAQARACDLRVLL